jgi:hypothetical protein
MYSRSGNDYDIDTSILSQKGKDEEDDKKKDEIKEHRAHKEGNDLGSSCHDQEELDR